MSPGGITPPAPRTVVVVPRKQVLVVAVGSLVRQGVAVRWRESGISGGTKQKRHSQSGGQDIPGNPPST